MRYRVVHVTKYAGEEPVSVGCNEALLCPRATPWQTGVEHLLKIAPPPSTLSERIDWHGNRVAAFAFNQGYRELLVEATTTLTLAPRTIGPQSPSAPWETLRDRLLAAADAEARVASEFRFASARSAPRPDYAAYAAASFAPGRPIVAALADLTRRIRTEFAYDPVATTVATPVAEVFRTRRGVCQDFAHFQIAALRSLGLAARYVSGYLRTVPPPGQARLVGADASHAWLACWCGDLGWIDVDPTNDVFCNLDHITVAWGRDYGDVAPLKGVYIGSGLHTLAVGADVEPLPE